MADLFSTFENDKDIFFDTDEFISYINSELNSPEFMSHRDSLQNELEATKITTIKAQNELIAYNDKKFTLLKDYVSSETDDIAKLQNIMDLLNKDISGTPRQLIADNSSVPSRSAHLLDEFNSYQKDVSVSNSDNRSGDR